MIDARVLATSAVKKFRSRCPVSVPSASLWFKNSSLSHTSLTRRSSIVAAFLSFYFPARFAICELQNANSSTAPRGFCKIFSRFGFFFQIWDHLLYSAKSDCLQSVTSGTAGLDFVSPPALHKGAPKG